MAIREKSWSTMYKRLKFWLLNVNYSYNIDTELKFSIQFSQISDCGKKIIHF